MGSLLHSLDYEQRKMARKVVTQKRQHDGSPGKFTLKHSILGLEVPQNSLELPVETFQSLDSEGDNIMYAYNGPYNRTEQAHYPTEAPIKKMISEETSEKHTKHNAPSVIARLMGVDMFPSETNPVERAVENKNETESQKLPNENFLKNGFNGHVPYDSKFSRQKRFNSFDSIETRNPDQWNDITTSDKPRRREHPQEEELQKFKNEFEAWQAARIKECSKFIELGRTPSQWLAQENLNREKIAFYPNSMGMTGDGMTKEVNAGTLRAHERGCFQNKEKKSFSSEQKDSFYARKRTSRVDFKLPPLLDSGNEFDPTLAPSKIVILRPGLDAMSIGEESWASSPCVSEERGSIEDFLEEVKERLKHELQGKAYKRSNSVRGVGIETPYSERPSDPKQIAQRIAKQVRESVTRDLGMNLFRSESTKSYRSEIHFNGTSSPEFISRDRRMFLAERLKNVLKEESHRQVPIVTHGSTRLSMLNTERHREEQSRYGFKAGNKVRNRNIIKDESDMQIRSFRRQNIANTEIHEESSPRNLIRSLSTPVSGTSFGKLLLEDRHILTGAHIRRKHEATEKITTNVKKRKKERFNLREKVTSLKYSFTFKGRLFGRKIQTSEKKHGNEQHQHHERDILSRPTMMMADYDRNENFTEVPPSPASVCSSVHEEFWRPAEYSSPVSRSDEASTEDSMMPNVIKDTSSNLNELRRQPNQLEIDCSEDGTNNEQPMETEMLDIEDQTEAYIRDLLLISGFYDGSCDKSLAKWDPVGKPINDQVFEEVEVSHKQKNEDDEGYLKDQNEKLNHKILFDLLNEALPNVLATPVSTSKFMRKTIDRGVRPLRGNKLLDQVWQIIRVYVHPPMDKSYYYLDTLISRDLQSSPWIDDDVNALGKDMECQIFGDLLDEMVMDIQS